MLDLLCNILKWLLAITLLRLLSSAFNWEFGVSRNYLRLLELMFELGERRIRKVQSRGWIKANKLAASSGRSQPELAGPAGRQLGASASWPTDDLGRGDAELETHLGDEDYNTGDTDTDADQDQDDHNKRPRKPDGPPVFLLDLDSHEPAERQLRHFRLADANLFVARAVQAIVDDQVTKRFTPEQLKSWNWLTRNNAKNYHFMSRSLGLLWLLGLVARYGLLLPLRIMFTLAGACWLTFAMAIIGHLPGAWRARPYRLVSLMSFRMLSCGITSRLKFHNRQYRAKNGDICVANHTSPLDAVLLACDNCYALVGQRHGGLLGLLERALSRAANHVWFDRAEGRDRQLVTQRLKQHISLKSNLPVLIFPEGTCINNSAVMMFRKGCFETTNRVCPVAIKYDSRFGDPFWNSAKQSYVQYLLLMMSSWAIKCDVWYLEPMERLADESAAQFAQRVKSQIARQAHLVDLQWDGQLKRMAAKVEWMHQQQEDYAKRLALE